MAQFSFLWDKTPVGDGQSYDWDEWASYLDMLFLSDNTSMGVISGYLNELEVTPYATNEAQVDTGVAMVVGRYYRNTSALVITGLGNGTSGLIVLQMINANKTIRAVARAAGALVQNLGVQWEIPLAEYSVDGAGTVTITDTRVFILMPLSNAFINTDANWKKISETYGTGASGQINVTVPATYEHLHLIVTARGDTAAITTPITMIMNADAGNNYNWNHILANYNVVSQVTGALDSSISVGRMPASLGTANYLSTTEIWIPYYKETGMHLGGYLHHGCIPNGTPAVTNWQTLLCGWKWSSVAVLNSIRFIAGAGNFTTQTKIDLYGIKE